MTLYVATNTLGMRFQHNLNKSSSVLDTTYQRLSSGMRINGASDDSAGLQISNRMTSQISGLNQSVANANYGIAFIQTVDGAMSSITDILQEIRTMVIQALAGTYTRDEISALEDEASTLANEITSIAANTTYGGKKILAGVDGNKIDGTNYTIAAVGSTIYGTNKYGKTLGQANADNYGKMTLQIGYNNGDTLEFGVHCMAFTTLMKASTTDAEFKKYTANNGPVEIKEEAIVFNFQAKDPTGQNFYSSDYLITLMDRMISTVGGQRNNLGAMMLRLESAIRNNNSVAINTADSRSRIQDSDFADESSTMSKYQTVVNSTISAHKKAVSSRNNLFTNLTNATEANVNNISKIGNEVQNSIKSNSLIGSDNSAKVDNTATGIASAAGAVNKASPLPSASIFIQNSIANPATSKIANPNTSGLTGSSLGIGNSSYSPKTQTKNSIFVSGVKNTNTGVGLNTGLSGSSNVGNKGSIGAGSIGAGSTGSIGSTGTGSIGSNGSLSGSIGSTGNGSLGNGSIGSGSIGSNGSILGKDDNKGNGSLLGSNNSLGNGSSIGSNSSILGNNSNKNNGLLSNNSDLLGSKDDKGPSIFGSSAPQIKSVKPYSSFDEAQDNSFFSQQYIIYDGATSMRVQANTRPGFARSILHER